MAGSAKRPPRPGATVLPVDETAAASAPPPESNRPSSLTLEGDRAGWLAIVLAAGAVAFAIVLVLLLMAAATNA